MTPAKKSAGREVSQPTIATTLATTTGDSGRKPWKKKTAVEVVLAQIDRVRDDVAKKEEEFKAAKRQLEKLEEARKVLEST
jgi:hypothetical protein